jgi:ABC-type dipeptide/oligopeptide/nickel transport system permease component
VPFCAGIPPRIENQAQRDCAINKEEIVMDMAKYVVKRVLFLLLTFVIIISMCFILIRLLPNETAAMFGKDMQLVLQSRYRQGLTDINGNPIPLPIQYWNFITKTLLGANWGISEKL